MSKPRKFHSLATKFSVFTAILVLWMTSAQISFRLSRQYFSIAEHIFLSLVLLVCAVALAKLTSRLFVRPLVVLESALSAVGQGCRKPIPVSHTSDEIEKLGESFNQTIGALAATEQAVREHQEGLEQKIRERTVALQEAMKRAESASRAKSEFLANMSHELRTPLNGVLGMIDMVLASPLAEKQQEDLITAKECSLSLLALVDDILDLSKIEAGRMTLEQVPFDPRTLMRDCMKAVQPRAAAKGVSLTQSISQEMPPRLLGDPLRLRQVLINLLGNAAKFTDHGSVRLSASSRASRPGVIELHWKVEDTGIGVPLDKLETIFEEFTQADGSVTRKYGGTGLGLSISKKIVDLHGGRIWVESQLGRGSTFHVVLDLPRVEPLAELVPVEGKSRDAAGENRPSGTAPRILVVEDNPVNRKVVTGILGKRGYGAVAVNDGQEALEALEKSAYDLVLMDVQMPVMDGLEATRRIRQDPRWRSLPVVALTAHATRGDRERCLQAGMDDYLAKPLNADALVATLSRLLKTEKFEPSPLAV